MAICWPLACTAIICTVTTVVQSTQQLDQLIPEGLLKSLTSQTSIPALKVVKSILPLVAKKTASSKEQSKTSSSILSGGLEKVVKGIPKLVSGIEAKTKPKASVAVKSNPKHGTSSTSVKAQTNESKIVQTEVKTSPDKTIASVVAPHSGNTIDESRVDVKASKTKTESSVNVPHSGGGTSVDVKSTKANSTRAIIKTIHPNGKTLVDVKKTATGSETAVSSVHGVGVDVKTNKSRKGGNSKGAVSVNVKSSGSNASIPEGPKVSVGVKDGNTNTLVDTKHSKNGGAVVSVKTSITDGHNTSTKGSSLNNKTDTSTGVDVKVDSKANASKIKVSVPHGILSGITNIDLTIAHGKGTAITCHHTVDCPPRMKCDSVEKKCYPKKNSEPSHLRHKPCFYNYQCPNRYFCKGHTCFWGSEKEHHAFRACSTDQHCPPDYTCDVSHQTCYKNGNSYHLGSQWTCLKSYQCPPRYMCRSNMCYLDQSGAEHAQFVKCAGTFNCPIKYRCLDQTCYRNPSQKPHLLGIDCKSNSKKCPVLYKCITDTCFQS